MGGWIGGWIDRQTDWQKKHRDRETHPGVSYKERLKERDRNEELD